MGSESDGVDLVADCLMLVVLLLQGLVLSNNEHGHPHLHAIWFMLHLGGKSWMARQISTQSRLLLNGTTRMLEDTTRLLAQT